MKANRHAIGWLVVAGMFLAAGCARNGLVMELSGSVMYEKPRIERVFHTLTDSRDEGGSVVVSIVVVGDAGLRASFDIAPGIAIRVPMSETEAGNYAGEFIFPPSTVGGPFTILGRVWHEDAGEVVLRDPEPITIPLLAATR
jgi:hypothetical protein